MQTLRSKSLNPVALALQDLVQVGYRRFIEPNAQGTQTISIVGLSCRFPGQPGINGFWASASGPGDIQSEVHRARWDIDRAYSPDIKPGKMHATTR